MSPLTKWYKCALCLNACKSRTHAHCVMCFLFIVLLNLESSQSQCLIGFLFCHRNIFSLSLLLCVCFFLFVRSIHCSIVILFFMLSVWSAWLLLSFISRIRLLGLVSIAQTNLQHFSCYFFPRSCSNYCHRFVWLHKKKFMDIFSRAINKITFLILFGS